MAPSKSASASEATKKTRTATPLTKTLGTSTVAEKKGSTSDGACPIITIPRLTDINTQSESSAKPTSRVEKNLILETPEIVNTSDSCHDNHTPPSSTPKDIVKNNKDPKPHSKAACETVFNPPQQLQDLHQDRTDGAPIIASTSQTGISNDLSHLQSTSAAALPSLEHNRFLYPWPRPTNLKHTSPVLFKYKSPHSRGKKKITSDDEWIPESEAGSNSEGFEEEGDLAHNRHNYSSSSPIEKKNTTSGAPVGCDESDTLTQILRTQESPNFHVTKNSVTLQAMSKLLQATNVKIEGLNSAVQTLSHLVQKLVGGSPQVSNKTRGGRTAVGIFSIFL